MADGTPKNVLFRDIALGSTVSTGGLLELAHKKIKMHILEMEDVLFHLESSLDSD